MAALAITDNFPQTLTNPEVVWDHTPPAEALSQLADLYGCRVIYQPNSRRVLVVPIGVGDPLPNFPYETIGATIEGPKAPAAVGVFGAPIKFQLRFLLGAVGEEWDGTYLPFNQLSYSPVILNTTPQISQIAFLGGGVVGSLGVFVNIGNFTEGFAADDTGGATVATRYATIIAGLMKCPGLAGFTFASDGVANLTITGPAGVPFTLDVNDDGSGPLTFQGKTVQVAVNAKTNSWGNTNVPLFDNAQATDRLSYTEARALAQKTVYRCYRILNRDPDGTVVNVAVAKGGDQNAANRVDGITVPKVGKIQRRQQILLQETKVMPVTPQPRIPGAVNKGNPLPPANPFLPLFANVPGVLPEFYNGFYPDAKNTVMGSISKTIGSALWVFVTIDDEDEDDEDVDPFNTRPTDRVFVPFSLNQVEQMIVFAEPVYNFVGGAGGKTLIQEPLLTLECGCYILDPNTNQPFRYEQLLTIPGGVAPIEWQYREDVVASVFVGYDDNNKVIGFADDSNQDAKARANYYLQGMAAKYQIKGGETRGYIGIIPHDPDGYTQQITWSIGSSGASTTVSGNTEHHIAVPSYPARRRAENLSPNKSAAAANRVERDLLDKLLPKELK